MNFKNDSASKLRILIIFLNTEQTRVLSYEFKIVVSKVAALYKGTRYED